MLPTYVNGFSSTPGWVCVAGRAAAVVVASATGKLDFDSVVTVVVRVKAAAASDASCHLLHCHHAGLDATGLLAVSAPT